jgi:hypothetical protein
VVQVHVGPQLSDQGNTFNGWRPGPISATSCSDSVLDFDDWTLIGRLTTLRASGSATSRSPTVESKPLNPAATASGAPNAEWARRAIARRAHNRSVPHSLISLTELSRSSTARLP